MSTLKLFFLGPPRIALDDEAVAIELRKGVALLAYLAVTGQSHSRDALGTLLWPNSNQRRARSYLRHALWLLKKALGDNWLEISREQVMLQPEANIWLDVKAFQQGVAAKVEEGVGGLARLAGQDVPNLFDEVGYSLQRLEQRNAKERNPAAAAALHEAEGIVTLLQNTPQKAIEPLRQAVSLWQTLGRPYDQIRALSSLGQAVSQTKNSRQAREVFAKAHRLVESLAAQLDEAELKTSFLNSPPAQKIRERLAS